MNNLEYVKEVEKILKMPTVFAYGTYGEKVTNDLIAKVYLTQRYKYHSDENILKLKEHYGEYAYECSALITEPLQLATRPSANEIYKISKEKFLIDDMPNIPGICVYFLGHVGVYIGCNTVAESTYASNVGFGVTTTRLSDRPWTTAFKLPWIDYKEE